jgi:hypothetical protein
MLGAALIHPDQRAVIPLMPEPIVNRDGTDKNDCERNAAKRFVAKLRQDHPHLKFIVTEDSLSSNAPHIETLHAQGLHYILGVKEGDHASLFKQVQAAAHAGRVTDYERHDRATGVVHRFRFVNDVSLNASRADVRVNVIAYWEMGKDKVQSFSWVTDLWVNKRNVYKLMRGGRARWKIENETFNTLKNQGYNFEHNYGHGEQNLSVVFATMMLLAFLINLTAYPVSGGLLPYAAQRVYHVDATGLGWLVASFAFGGLIASIATVWTGGPRHAERWTLVCAALWYALLLGFGHVQSFGVGLLVLMLAGFVQNVAMIAMIAILLAAAGDRFRGRVMGVRMLAVYGLPLGLIASGVLIERIGYPLAITVSTAVGLICTVLIGIRWRTSIWHPRRTSTEPTSVPQGV